MGGKCNHLLKKIFTCSIQDVVEFRNFHFGGEKINWFLFKEKIFAQHLFKTIPAVVSIEDMWMCCLMDVIGWKNGLFPHKEIDLLWFWSCAEIKFGNSDY